MKKIIVVGMMLALFGCSQNFGENSDAHLKPISVDQHFVQELRENVASARSATPEGIVKLGKVICQSYKDGANTQQIVNVGARSGMTIEEITFTIKSATQHYCPKYSDVDKGREV
jgi:hypothetical protein